LTSGKQNRKVLKLIGTDGLNTEDVESDL